MAREQSVGSGRSRASRTSPADDCDVSAASPSHQNATIVRIPPGTLRIGMGLSRRSIVAGQLVIHQEAPCPQPWLTALTFMRVVGIHYSLYQLKAHAVGKASRKCPGGSG